MTQNTNVSIPSHVAWMTHYSGVEVRTMLIRKDVLKALAPVTCDDDTRYSLRGVSVTSLADGPVVYCATDGAALLETTAPAAQVEDWPFDITAAQSVGVVRIPVRDKLAVVDSKPNTAVPITAYLAADRRGNVAELTAISGDMQPIRQTVNSQDTEFPNYGRLFPSSTDGFTTLCLDARLLRRVCDAIISLSGRAKDRPAPLILKIPPMPAKGNAVVSPVVIETTDPGRDLTTRGLIMPCNL